MNEMTQAILMQGRQTWHTFISQIINNLQLQVLLSFGPEENSRNILFCLKTLVPHPHNLWCLCIKISLSLQFLSFFFFLNEEGLCHFFIWQIPLVSLKSHGRHHPLQGPSLRLPPDCPPCDTSTVSTALYGDHFPHHTKSSWRKGGVSLISLSASSFRAHRRPWRCLLMFGSIMFTQLFNKYSFINVHLY